MTSTDSGSPLPAGNASPDPVNDDGGDTGVNLGLAVGIPVGVVGGLIIILIIILLLWKWKYKRKYSMNESFTPTKNLTHHEEQLGSASPPGHPGTKNGSTVSRPEILLRTPSREADLYVVRHYYAAEESDQLTLQTGRIVEVVEKNTNGWWRGMIEDEVGWFPAAYVRKIEASEKVKYRQQSNQNTPEKKSASPKRLVKRNQENLSKKKAPAIPNGTKPREHNNVTETNGTLETSVRSDTHQLISSGEESVVLSSQDDVTDRSSKEPITDIEAVDSEEKLEVEDEVTPRSSMVETPEICRKTQSASDPIEELQTLEIQKPSLTSPGNTQNLGLESREEFEQLGSSIQVRENDLNQCSIGGVVDATSSGIWKQTESPPVVSGVGGLAGSQDETTGKPTPVKRKRPRTVTGENVSSGREEDRELARSSLQGNTPSMVLHSTPKRKSAADNVQTYVAMYPFTAVHREQLSLSPNDVIQSNGHVVNGWIKGHKRGETQEGWFPESYVREAHENGNQSNEGKILVEKSLSESEFSDVADHSFDDELTGMAYRVIHPYTARQEGDLDLKDGDLVVVLESLDNGWWRGVLAGKEGWFPGSYVQVIPQTPMISKDMQNPFRTLPRNFKQGELPNDEVEEPSADVEEERSKRSTLPTGMSPAMMQDDVHSEDTYTGDQNKKPAVPKRFVIPKLVKAHKNRSQKQRPVKPPPPAPPPVLPGSTDYNNPIAPPRRSKRSSVSRPTVPPPRPPSELDSSQGSGEHVMMHEQDNGVQGSSKSRSQKSTHSVVHETSPYAEVSQFTNPYADIDDVTDRPDDVGGADFMETSLSPSLYGHNGSQVMDASICTNEQSLDGTIGEVQDNNSDTEVFEDLVTMSPIYRSAGDIVGHGDDTDMSKGMDESVDLDSSAYSGLEVTSPGMENKGQVSLDSFYQERDYTGVNSSDVDILKTEEPVYAVVQNKKKTGIKDASVTVKSSVSPSLKNSEMAEKSPKTEDRPVSQGFKSKPVIAPKPPTPVVEAPHVGDNYIGNRVNLAEDLVNGYENAAEVEMTDVKLIGVPDIKEDKRHKQDMGKCNKRAEAKPLSEKFELNDEEQDQSLLAEIMSSFEDLRTSIDAPSKSLSASAVVPSTSGHDSLSDISSEKEPARGHCESSIIFEKTLPGIGSHKTHQEGRKSHLLPATYAHNPMEMGSKQQSVVYDSNQEVGSPPSKAAIQDKPPLPAKPSISPKSISGGNSDMSSRSESSFERSNITSDTSHSAEANENSLLSNESNKSLNDYGIYPDSINLSGLPDEKINDSDIIGNYTGNTSDEPPPLPEGPPPESPLIETRLPKPKKSVIAKALKSQNSDLIMTSPYVVIRTPEAGNQRLQDMDTEEVTMLTRSTEVMKEPYQDEVKRKSGSNGSEKGLKHQISGFLDKILPNVFHPDFKNRESSDQEVDPPHPVSQIEFMDSFNFKRKYQGTWNDQVYTNGYIEGEGHKKSDIQEQSNDLSLVDNVSDVSSTSTSPGTKPKSSNRPAKPPRKSKSISSDEERSFMKQQEDGGEPDEHHTEKYLKSTEETVVTKYQLPALRPPPVTDLTERYRKSSSAGSSIVSIGSSPPVSPDSSSNSPRYLGTSTPRSHSLYGHHEEVDSRKKEADSGDRVIVDDAVQNVIESWNGTSVADQNLSNKSKSESDSPLRFFTPSKFTAKPYTPSPQIIQRGNEVDSDMSHENNLSGNEIHLQVDNSQENYNVKVLNSINTHLPSDDYKVTSIETKQLGQDSRIIQFDTPKPFQKPGQLKKVIAPQSQPPRLIQYIEEDGRVYI